MEKEVKKPILAQIGTRLREIREAKNIPLKKMAQEIGITPQALSQIENGKADISISRILEFSQYLHVDYSEILSAVSSTVNNFHSTNNSGAYHVQAVNNTFNMEWTEELKAFIRDEIKKAK